MKKVKLEDIKNSRGSTNWAAVIKQNDTDIEKAAVSSDAKILTDAELSQLRRESDGKGSK